MARILILHGSTGGQTARIAARLATVARANDHEAQIIDAAPPPSDQAFAGMDGVVIGAPVRRDRHPASIRDVIVAHRATLTRLPSAFFSVSVTAASPNEEKRRHADRRAQDFLRQVGWQPALVTVFGGVLPYRDSPWLERQLWRLGAAYLELDTDPSRNYEYTDWAAVTRFAEAFLAVIA